MGNLFCFASHEKLDLSVLAGMEPLWKKVTAMSGDKLFDDGFSVSLPKS